MRRVDLARERLDEGARRSEPVLGACAESGAKRRIHVKREPGAQRYVGDYVDRLERRDPFYPRPIQPAVSGEHLIGDHGERVLVRTAVHALSPSPFGSALVMTTERGLAGLAFADPGEEDAALDDMRGRWSKARYGEDKERTGAIARRIFDPTL